LNPVKNYEVYGAYPLMPLEQRYIIFA